LLPWTAATSHTFNVRIPNDKEHNMSEIAIRQVQGEEMLDLTHTLYAYSFEPSPPVMRLDEETRRKSALYMHNAICIALLENGHPMSMAFGLEMSQHVRGRIQPMGGVMDVATHPAARHKGYARQVMTHLFAAMRDAGVALSALYPFRESFYERLGYISFPQPRAFTLVPGALAPLLKRDLGGSVEHVPIAEGFESYLAYVRAHQGRTHGMALGNDHWAARLRDQNRSWLAIARVGRDPVGIMCYRLRGRDQSMPVRPFFYHDSRGRYLLLEWLARHDGQTKTLDLRLSPAERPETWLADLKVQSRGTTSPMGRVIDLCALQGVRTGPGRFVAQIHDPLCPWNEGCYQFETIDGALHVTPAQYAECDLSIQGLSALAYGTNDPGDLPFRGWGDPAAETQVAMRAMFPPMQPYLHEDM
jgi:predicted acetyltransferase